MAGEGTGEDDAEVQACRDCHTQTVADSQTPTQTEIEMQAHQAHGHKEEASRDARR